MTYEQYIEETANNCKIALADCSNDELQDIEHLRRILWEDDNVTGVLSGVCSSMKGMASNNIKGVLFDSMFLADFNAHNLNMQKIMLYGPEAVDVVARCLALNHISILKLVREEKAQRLQREKESHRYSVRV